MILFCSIATIVTLSVIGGIIYAINYIDTREITCRNCKRVIYNKNWKTPNGCQWCDDTLY